MRDTISKTLKKVDHPAFEYYSDVGEMVVATFRVGYYEQVPKAVRDAASRVQRALKDHAGDIALVREWDGNVAFYPPNSRLINPEVPEDTKANFILAATKASGWVLDDSWVNSSHGVTGFSVRLRKPAEGK